MGLPDRQMGNSEVGHMNMGAGRIVYQDLTRIDQNIRDSKFSTNPVLQAAMGRCRTGSRALHLMGLVSDGGVHSHQRHLHALLELASRLKVPRVFVHAFTDGRDCPPTGAREYLGELEQVMARLGTGRIASVSGRYYAMDRDRRWDRTRRAWAAITLGEGKVAPDAASLSRSPTEPASPTISRTRVIATPAAHCATFARTIRSSFSTSGRSCRQMTRAISFEQFDGFEADFSTRQRPTMTRYDATFGLPVVFEPQTFTNSLAEVLAGPAVANLRLAETEKYAHVTYFFNCGVETPYPGEDRILVPSQKVATYDLMPEMSAPGITDQLVADLDARASRIIICNFANADMSGSYGQPGRGNRRRRATLDRCLAES